MAFQSTYISLEKIRSTLLSQNPNNTREDYLAFILYGYNRKSIFQYPRIQKPFLLVLESDITISTNIDIFISYRVVREQSSSNSGSTVPHNHDIVSAIDLDEDSSYCQIHSYENSRTPNNILRSFPPPYTETCPLNSMNLQERNYSSENQRINDGILYELDSQYLHQILPSSNPPSNTNNSSSNYVYRNYANNGRK